MPRKIVDHAVILVLMSFILVACSSVGSPANILSATQGNTPLYAAIELPAAWTATVRPTLVPTKTVSPASNEFESADMPFALPALTLATPVPASLSTAAWQKVEGTTASFMLPGSFEVLDMGSEFGMLMAALMTGLMEGMMEVAGELGEQFGAEAITPTPMDLSEVETALNIDLVLAIAGDQKTSAFLFSEPVDEPLSLEEQMQATLDEQENPMEVLSMHRVTDAVYETGRINLLATDPETGERGHVLIFVILHPERVYQLGYTAAVDRFEEMLPIFDTSASSFRVNP